MRNTIKWIMTINAILIGFNQPMFAQVDSSLKEEVVNTGYIHRPLSIDLSKAFETEGLNKEILKSVLLNQMDDVNDWSHKGIGNLKLTDERSITGTHSLRLSAPSHPEKILDWGLGRGTSMATFEVGGANWEDYNRLRFFIYPMCEGDRSVYLNLYVENDGEIKVPDRFGREGYHEINLINNQWNECFVEMTGLPRDKVSKISFAIEVFGKELTMGDSLVYDIDAITLEKVKYPEVVKGWQPADNRIIFSTTGYRPESNKSAIVNVNKPAKKFLLKNADTKEVVYSGLIKNEVTKIGKFSTIDFTDFKTPGKYIIQVGDVATMPFYIDDNVWDDSAWRVLNFMFSERCGYPVTGKHGVCHTDIHAVYNDKIYPINGGWHDAADMSQQALQTGEIAYSLMQAANSARQKGNITLYNRLMEEALWGVDFIMRARLSDGYRAQTWGTNLWTDGFIGTIDDEGRREMLVHNGALENFLFSGIEAYAAMSIENDEALKSNLTKIAQEDFAYAIKRFDELGFAELVRKGGGHAGMASQSQYYANISWAASMLYALTDKSYYANEAAKTIEYTLECQRKEPINDLDGMRGFFYRDLAKKSIVHFTHQSRDYAYMEALAALCETQPYHQDYGKWKESMQLYGEYLKNTIKYVYPYGMLPSGIYHKDEINDSINFYAVQVGIRKGAEEDFREQYNNGMRLDDEHCMRVFPIWFSFKGNIAVHLSTGKAAAICARVLGDSQLKDIAEQQLFWVVGKNPFGQSMIYGEGSNYPQLYTALLGETVGAIPVGMQSYFNEDEPYWPQFTTATYKEVWGSSAARWLMLLSEF